jgi:small-conductance mechanosensitive channel
MSEVLKVIQSNVYALAAVIMLASIVGAFLVEIITTRVLLRLTAKTQTVVDDEIVAALRRPLFYSVVLVGIWQTMRQVRPADADHSLLTRVLVTAAVLLWMGGGMRMARSILGALARQAGVGSFVQQRTLPLFEISLKTLIVGGAIYGVLQAWNVDVTAWLASAGIIGIAVGFAAKDTLANLFSGIFILADAPYKIGDYIVLDSGERGKVTDIGIRSTRILTRDDLEIIIPNAAIGNAKIINESGGPHIKRRVCLTSGGPSAPPAPPCSWLRPSSRLRLDH